VNFRLCEDIKTCDFFFGAINNKNHIKKNTTLAISIVFEKDKDSFNNLSCAWNWYVYIYVKTCTSISVFSLKNLICRAF